MDYITIEGARVMAMFGTRHLKGRKPQTCKKCGHPAVVTHMGSKFNLALDGRSESGKTSHWVATSYHPINCEEF